MFEAPWALWGVGICAAWRRMARALADTGSSVFLSLDDFYGNVPDPRVLQEVGRLVQPRTARALVVGFPTRGDAEQAAVIRASLARPIAVALTTMIERDRIGPLSVAAANGAKQWWLPCQANIDAFRRSGVQDFRLHKVHIPFFPDDPHLSLVGRGRHDGPIHFYRIGVIDTRKDQKKTVHAFLRAFRPGEARLTLKTTHVAGAVTDLWSVLVDPEVQSNGWNDSNVRVWVNVIHDVWSEAQLLDLHRQGDVYLSLSHGEGWDLPAFDALLSGNRLIYSESGGPEEFVGEGDIRVPTSAMVPCDPVYRWEPDARWTDFKLEDAASAMQEAARRPLPKTHRRSWAGFTSADVGALMQNLLADLVSPSIRRVAPRPPPKSEKGSLAVISLFRQCPHVVQRYRDHINALDWPSRPHIVCVEGDSTDSTPDLLDAWAKENDRVHVIHHSLGNPLFGSTLNPLRLRTLATVSNVGLDYITQYLNVEYVLFLTSDLMYDPKLLVKRLHQSLEQLPRAGLVAPMVWRDGVFYDTWAFRGNVSQPDPRFATAPSRAMLETTLGQEPLRLDSVGSVLFCRAAAIYGGVRFTEEEDVIGFSKNMRRAGFSVWADPGAHTHHPHEVQTAEIRAHADAGRQVAAASALHTKWTGYSEPAAINELAKTFTLRELLTAEAPLEANEAIARGKTDILHVYLPNSVPHGVASHAMFLRDAHPQASWVRSIDVARQISDNCKVRSLVLQIQWGCYPTGEALSAEAAAVLDLMRSRGVRVIVNYHHAEPSAEWVANARTYREHSDELVFHHPEAVEIAGGGTYFPLPVPSFQIRSREPLGGLAFMGFADPSRRIDLLVGVAERLGVPIYGYGPRLDLIPSWYETRGWRQFRPRRAYMNEAECATELGRHSVAMLARAVTSRAYSSASARFCMAAGLPVVVDHSKSYEDLREHVGAVVDYDDHAATDAVVRRLLEDERSRSEAIERQRRYTETYSFAALLREMGIA